MKSIIARLMGLAVVAALVAVTGHGQSPEPTEPTEPTESSESTEPGAAAARTEPWDPAVVAAFAKLPIQDEGRVKPLQTYAMWTLLRHNGRRSAKTPDDERLGPTEWLLDLLFFPEQAKRYETFLVRNSEVLDAIGLSEMVARKEKRKSDRYSFEDLYPARNELQKLYDRYGRVERKELDLVTGQALDLYRNLADVQVLIHYFDFARRSFPLRQSLVLQETFGARESVSFSEVFAHAPRLGAKLMALTREPPADLNAEAFAAERDALAALLSEFRHYGRLAAYVALFPPQADAPAESPWLTVEEITEQVLSTTVPAEYQPALAAFEQIAASPADSAALAAPLDGLQVSLVSLASARGEYDKIEAEVAYYNWDLFFLAQYTFVLAFVLIALSWLGPRANLFARGGLLLSVVACVMVATGMVMRSQIRTWTGVSTLYETILLITLVSAVVALVIEAITRKRIGLPIAAFVGAAGMFLASGFELGNATDTMPRLVAVLRTNFWLTTHVNCVLLGYVGGLLAGVIAHVYIFGRLLGLKKGDHAFYRLVARMVYGVLCFGLLFAVVGTILGGVWANDSWGRFWGWDPKENGALMICLWQIAILHGRMGGYLRDLGVCIAAVLGAAVVAFSWWGVNMLGVGLHSYGFTDGAMWLYVFYGFEGLVASLGVGMAFAAWRQRRQVAAEASMDFVSASEA